MLNEWKVRGVGMCLSPSICSAYYMVCGCACTVSQETSFLIYLVNKANIIGPTAIILRVFCVYSEIVVFLD